MREKILHKIKDAFERMQKSPFYTEFYYSLIRFPDGRHLPLPIALRKEILTFRDLRKIPLSRKKRDGFYFTCFCGAKSFWHCKGWFYTKEQQREETKIKEIALRRLIVEGKHKKLRVVLPDMRWFMLRPIPVDRMRELEPCPYCPYNGEFYDEWDESLCEACIKRMREVRKGDGDRQRKNQEMG